jgi:Protein of unknown function (DUF2510).
MASQAGWYPDPGGQPGMYRYWTGSAWTEAITPYPQSTPAPQVPTAPTVGPAAPRGSRSTVGWVVGIAAVVVVGLVMWAFFGMGGAVPSADPTVRAPGGESSADICPQPASSDVSSAAPEQSDGRVRAGNLSFPQLGDPWTTPSYDNRVPYGDLGVEQAALDQEDYDGQAGHSWVSSIMVAPLLSGEGFPSTKNAAELILKCVVGIYYDDTNVQRSDTSSTSFSVDGHDGWLIESELSFSIAGLNATSETVLLAVVQISGTKYSLFYASVPNTSADRLPEVRTALADLQVEE